MFLTAQTEEKIACTGKNIAIISAISLSGAATFYLKPTFMYLFPDTVFPTTLLLATSGSLAYLSRVLAKFEAKAIQEQISLHEHSR